ISTEASCAKMFATEMCGRVADRGVQIHGGAGYISEYAIERFYRDVRLFRLYEGTTQIQQVIIARNMIREVEDCEPPAGRVVSPCRSAACRLLPCTPHGLHTTLSLGQRKRVSPFTQLQLSFRQLMAQHPALFLPVQDAVAPAIQNMHGQLQVLVAFLQPW